MCVHISAEVKAQDVISSSRETQLEIITVPTSCLLVITAVRGRRHHLKTEECSRERDEEWVTQSSHSLSSISL